VSAKREDQEGNNNLIVCIHTHDAARNTSKPNAERCMERDTESAKSLSYPAI
jgi:hypothetical protein